MWERIFDEPPSWVLRAFKWIIQKAIAFIIVDPLKFTGCRDNEAAYLWEYYRQNASNMQGYERYTFHFENKLIETAILTKPQFCNLNIPLTLDTAKFHFNRTVPPMAPQNGATGAYAKKIQGRLHRLKAVVKDNPIYVLTELDPTLDNITFSPKTFVSHRFGPGLLGDEANDLARKFGSDVAKMVQHSDIRNLLLPDLACVVNPSGRACAGGVGVVLALEEDYDFRILVGIRSKKVAVSPGRMALVPQGYHGYWTDPIKECSVFWSAIRETYEEVLRGDVENADNRLSLESVIRSDKRISPFLNPTRAQYIWTCFGFNLLQGNYDFGLLLIVKDPYLISLIEAEVPNWEVERVQWCHTRNQDDLRALITDPTWVHEGHFHLIQGLKALQKYDSTKILPIELDDFVR